VRAASEKMLRDRKAPSECARQYQRMLHDTMIVPAHSRPEKQKQTPHRITLDHNRNPNEVARL
jgi:hypothetical protein